MSGVFISYSSKDRDFVRQLADDLHSRLPDTAIFYDKLIEPGASWADALADQIESADVIVAVLSPDYLSSAWAQQEMSLALDRHLKRTGRLIPILVRPCSPTGFLSQFAWVDFTGDYESGLANLIWGITGQKPRAAKGDQPGELSGIADPQEIASLRREVQQAVALFKSGDRSGPSPSPSPAPDGRRRCFIVMPFGDTDLQIVYEDFVKPTLEEACGLECSRGDDVFGSHIVMDDIIQSISGADVVVADLTRKNANVFYEVGICHALKKPVLLLAQVIDEVPFDLRHRRVFLYDYSPRGCKRLEATLADNMRAVLAEL